LAASAFAAVLLSIAGGACAQDSAESWRAAYQAGIQSREKGDIRESIQLLISVLKSAASPAARLAASEELGASLLRAYQYEEAERILGEAHLQSEGAQRARIALALGNAAHGRRNPETARARYVEAQAEPAEEAVRIAAALNLARMALPADRLQALEKVMPSVARVADAALRARFYLNLGHLARTLGDAGTRLSYEAFSRAQQPSVSDPRLGVQILDAMARLYEDAGRDAEAQKLNTAALARAGSAPLGLVQDLLIELEWRQGRIHRRTGDRDRALAAYRRAAGHAEAVRQDLPIEFEDGTSTYQEMLRPVYLGLADLLLDGADGPASQEQLESVVSHTEFARQSEMQDYLGERCALAAEGGDASQPLPGRTAMLYPLVFEDRLELLLKIGGRIERRTVQVKSDAIRILARSFVNKAQEYDAQLYVPDARRLYDLLLRPLEGALEAERIDTLVVVPDGALRIIPFGALHDGQRFAIERFAVSTITGATMTSFGVPWRKKLVSLLAGMSTPGPVVEVLKKIEPDSTSDNSEAMKVKLSLPGVAVEIRELGQAMQNTTMLNDGFTLERFQIEAKSQDYNVLHIASHGVFGGSAKTSYIMAYDDLLTMERLQSLLASRTASNPIEVLTLSACETAEGDERSPLGISGAAIKAKAKSVVGTLWAVADEAARRIMTGFYAGLSSGVLGKTEAFRQAQLELLRDKRMAHPYFWSPFILIGNWQ